MEMFNEYFCLRFDVCTKKKNQRRLKKEEEASVSSLCERIQFISVQVHFNSFYSRLSNEKNRLSSILE